MNCDPSHLGWVLILSLVSFIIEDDREKTEKKAPEKLREKSQKTERKPLKLEMKKPRREGRYQQMSPCTCGRGAEAPSSQSLGRNITC